MKKITFLLFVLAATLSGCLEDSKTSSSSAADQEFQKLSEAFLEGYFAWRPRYAVSLGLHEYDGKITDVGMESIHEEIDRIRKYDQLLSVLDTSSLSPDRYTYYRILRYAIGKEIFNFEEMYYYAKNPMIYAFGLDVGIYINRNFAPLEDRLRSIISIEEQASTFFAHAKMNLEDSLALPYIQTAIQIANGLADFFEGELILALKNVRNDSLMTAFEAANNNAIHELRDFAAFLEEEKLQKAHNNYALGKEKYQKMLLYGENISLPAEAILQIGLEELEKEQKVFAAMAEIIDPDKTPVEVYRDLQKEHPTEENLIAEVKENLEEIRQFLLDNNIVTIPSEERAQVKETPKYARSMGMASMNPPGAFEKKATEAYYYITPVELTWTEKQKEEWLALFEYYTTDVISIHEVYPGHYVQFLHLNASSASDIQKIFGSYAFVEGWAHYTEKMMIDEGYGDTGDPIMAAKYRLAQSGEALVRLCRLCVSVKMHCQGMSVDEATSFFMDNWYQGEQLSRSEAIRGTYDPGYLYYTLGKLQMLKLREDYKQQEGDDYSLQKFHNLVLSYGMPPFQMLREQILDNREIWADML